MNKRYHLTDTRKASLLNSITPILDSRLESLIDKEKNQGKGWKETIINNERGHILAHLRGYLDAWAEGIPKGLADRETFSGKYSPSNVYEILYGFLIQRVTDYVDSLNDWLDVYETPDQLPNGGVGEYIFYPWRTRFIIADYSDRLLIQLFTLCPPSIWNTVGLSMLDDMAEMIRMRVGSRYHSANEFYGELDKDYNMVLNEAHKMVEAIKNNDSADDGKKFDDWLSSTSEWWNRNGIIYNGTLDKLINSASLHYKEGLKIYDLGLPCGTVADYLHQLYKLSTQLSIGMRPYSSQDGSYISPVRAKLEWLYKTLWDYNQAMCGQYVAGRAPYSVKWSLTDKRLGDLKSDLETNWSTVAPEIVKALFSAPRSTRNILSIFSTEYANSFRAIDALKDDPWNGPVMRFPDERVLPYDASPMGDILYRMWNHLHVNTALGRIWDVVHNPKPDKDDSEFQIPEILLSGLETVYHQKFNDQTPAGAHELAASIYDQWWQEFHDYLYGDIAHRKFTSVWDLKTDLDNKLNTIIEGVNNDEDRLRGNHNDAPPIRFFTLEEHASDLSSISTTDLKNEFDELKRMNKDIPWMPKWRLRYEKTYAAYKKQLDSIGGTEGTISFLNADDYVNQKIIQLRTSSYDTDRAVAVFAYGWVGEEGWKATIASVRAQLASQLSVKLRGYKTGAERINDWSNTYDRILSTVYDPWRNAAYNEANKVMDGMINEFSQGLKTGKPPSQTTFDKVNDALALGSLQAFSSKVQELNQLYEKWMNRGLSGGLIAGLRPFMQFKPVKSVGGFDVEEFALKDVDKLIAKWAGPRLAKGIYVDPKINGYRGILENRDHEVRIFMEGMTRDFSDVFKSLTEELSKCDDVILDSELLEETPSGEVIERAKLGRLRRREVDDSLLVANVFDILYWKGKDLTGLGYEERRKYLDQFFTGKDFKHLKKLPTWKVTTDEQLKEKIARARRWPGSEGAMLKTAASTYPVGKRTHEWAKVKRTEDVNVVVLERHENKAGSYNYLCGIIDDGSANVDPKDIRRFRGHDYIILGETFNTDLKAEPGDVIEVAITEFNGVAGPNGNRYAWQDPKVKGFEHGVTTLGQAIKIGELLAAGLLMGSIDMPYHVLADLWDAAMSATSNEQLAKIKGQVDNLLADLRNLRLRNIATVLRDYIASVLGYGPMPAITNKGLIPVNPDVVTEKGINELVQQWNGLKAAIDVPTKELRDKIKALWQSAGNWYNLVKQVNPSWTSILHDIVMWCQNTLDNYTTLTPDEITKALNEIYKELTDIKAGHAPISKYKEVSARFGKLVGSLTEGARNQFADEINKIQTLIEEEFGITYATNAVDEVLTNDENYLIKASDEVKNGNYGVEIEVRAVLDRARNLISKLAPFQLDMFKNRLQRITAMANDLLDTIEKQRRKVSGSMLMDTPVDWLTQHWMPLVIKGAVNYWPSLRRIIEQKGGWWAIVPPDAQPIVRNNFGMQDKLLEATRQKMNEASGEIEKELKAAPPERRDDLFNQLIYNLVINPAVDEFLKQEFPMDTPIPQQPWKVTEAHSGDPKQDMIEHMMYWLQSQRSEGVTNDFGPIQELDRNRYNNIKRGVDSLVTIVSPEGVMGGFYAGVGSNGKPLAITASHGVKEGDSVALTDASGHTMHGTCVYTASSAPEGQMPKEDIAVIEIDDDYPKENMLPLKPADSENGGVVLSPVWHVADEISYEPGKKAQWIYDWGKLAEFGQPGFSGSPVISNGKIAGMMVGTEFWNTKKIPLGRRYVILPLKYLKDIYNKFGLLRVKGAVLTKKGEENGFQRTDFMAARPIEIPVHGTLWVHVKGIDPDNIDKDYPELFRQRKDVLNLHHDVRFKWGRNYLEGFTIFLGKQTDFGKLLHYRGGKLSVTIKQKQPLIWGEPDELDKRLFPPHSVGNVEGKTTWGKMFFLDDIELLPSRMRPAPIGRRFYEFYLRFSRYTKLNGLWAISEEAAAQYSVPMMLFRMHGLLPFWLRKGHDKEKEEMPNWQKPTMQEVRRFLSGH